MITCIAFPNGAGGYGIDQGEDSRITYGVRSTEGVNRSFSNKNHLVVRHLPCSRVPLRRAEVLQSRIDLHVIPSSRDSSTPR